MARVELKSLFLLMVMTYFAVDILLGEEIMKSKKDFEEICRLLLEDRWAENAMPEISAEMDNLFYEKFGMSAEEINEVFRGRKPMD